MIRSRVSFSVRPLYRKKRRHFMRQMKQHLSFFIAMLTLVAFVAGNMVGQHGWYAFWTGMMGKEIDQTVFTGTVPPVEFVPDYAAWAKAGGNAWKDSFDSIPRSLLVPLPPYDPATLSERGERLTFAQTIYNFGYAGGYSRSSGSHPAVDIRMPEGTPVRSIANGTVEKVGNDPSGFGNYVVIEHPNVPDPQAPGKFTTLYSTYAHLSSASVKPGDIVSKGQQIGKSGSTGFASGPHLHYQIDLEPAPWHPYWPFTGPDAKAANMTFAQAVDSGLGRENLLLYTIDPMLFVNQYANYSSPVTVAANTLDSARKATSRSYSSLSPAERRQMRLSRMASVSRSLPSRTVVAYDDSVHSAAASVATPTVPEAVQSSSSSSDSNVSRTDRQVAGFSLRVDDTTPFICGKNSTVNVFATAINSKGDSVTNPMPLKDPLYINQEFGSAQAMTSFTTSDLQQGVLKLTFRLSGNKTFLFSLMNKTLGKINGPLIACQK